MTRTRSDLRRLLRLYRPHRRAMLGGTALAMIVILANVGLMALAGWFITAMALAGLGLGTINFFVPAAGIRGLAIVRTAGRYGERLISHDVTLRLLSDLRVWFYQRLEPLVPARLQNYRGGDLLSRIRADIDTLDNFYLNVWVPGVAAFGSTLILVTFLGWFDAWIALLDMAGLMTAGVLMPWSATRLGVGPGRQSVIARARLRAAAADVVRGLGELRIYQAMADQTKRFGARNHALVAPQRRQVLIDALLAAGADLVARLTVWGSLIIAITHVTRHELANADLTLIALLVLANFEAVGQLPLAFRSLGEARAAARRVFEIADLEPLVSDTNDDGTPPPSRFDIRLCNVHMRYDEAEDWALRGIDLVIEPGQRLAIVGPSGAGKSSVVQLLLRFRDCELGGVTIGGRPVHHFPAAVVRGWYGVVSQDTYLFNTSIRRNLLLAAPNASESMLIDVLRRSAMYDTVMALPRQLDTVVGETGARLSGGQARRIAVARALLRNAPILILDEPTEGLDAFSERAVLEALDPLMRDRTTLLITHRPQVLRYADRVAVMQRGHLVEHGDTARLMRESAHLSRYLHLG